MPLRPVTVPALWVLAGIGGVWMVVATQFLERSPLHAVVGWLPYVYASLLESILFVGVFFAVASLVLAQWRARPPAAPVGPRSVVLISTVGATGLVALGLLAAFVAVPILFIGLVGFGGSFLQIPLALAAGAVYAFAAAAWLRPRRLPVLAPTGEPARRRTRPADIGAGILLMFGAFLVAGLSFAGAAALDPPYPYRPSAGRQLVMDYGPWIAILAYLAGVHVWALSRRRPAIIATFWASILILAFVLVVTCFAIAWVYFH